MTPWIDFDIPRLEALRSDFQSSLEYTLGELPQINWNSPKQIKELFRNRFNYTLENATIRHLQDRLEATEIIPELHDTMNGAIQYLKLRFTITNYFDCILRHHENGRLYLRDIDGIWKLPNKRPLFHQEEIWGCVTGMSPDLANIGSTSRATW